MINWTLIIGIIIVIFIIIVVFITTKSKNKINEPVGPFVLDVSAKELKNLININEQVEKQLKINQDNLVYNQQIYNTNETEFNDKNVTLTNMTKTAQENGIGL